MKGTASFNGMSHSHSASSTSLSKISSFAIYHSATILCGSDQQQSPQIQATTSGSSPQPLSNQLSSFGSFATTVSSSSSLAMPANNSSSSPIPNGSLNTPSPFDINNPSTPLTNTTTLTTTTTNAPLIQYYMIAHGRVNSRVSVSDESTSHFIAKLDLDAKFIYLEPGLALVLVLF